MAGFPFIVLNTVCGSLAAYGFAGLRYTPSAIILFQVMLVLQSLAAVQLLILCVYATPTQACASFSPSQPDLAQLYYHIAQCQPLHWTVVVCIAILQCRGIPVQPRIACTSFAPRTQLVKPG